MNSISDSEIISRVKDGDVQSFTEIVRKYQDKVFRLCCSIVGQPAAEDAAQEIFIKVYGSLNDLKDTKLFSTWLYRVTYNHCLNILSKQKAARTTSLDSLEQEFVSPDLPASSRLETEETKRSVHQTLQALTPEERTILTLREMEGLSYKELADALEISIDTVKVRLFRSRKSFLSAVKKFL